MYLWKCWRDGRTRFIGSVIALPVLFAFVTFIAVKLGDPDAMQKGASPSVVRAWSTTTEVVFESCASIFTLIWGLMLGAASLGEEFKEKTADFLLVRPRRRRYWAWMGWWAGVCELSVMVGLAVGATFGTVVYLTGHVQTWWPLATILPLALGGTLAYGLTYLMALVARSGRQGLNYGIGILFIYLLLPTVVSHYWNVDLPSIWGFMTAACKWFTTASGAFPVGALLLWTVVALAFPFAAQLVLERREV
jgi:ABC-type transport system involved in multi-copper enzyme maturation permease subunit